MHNVFCILGRTCSGKSTITSEVADKLGMKILKSYTTRNLRDGETISESDHTFIDPTEVDKYRSDMVAYTERVGYCSFATKSQLLESDFYIINPEGFNELFNKKIDGIRLIPILIDMPEFLLKHRAKKNRDIKEWETNYQKESLEFQNFTHAYFYVSNIWEKAAIRKFIKIVKNFKNWG